MQRSIIWLVLLSPGLCRAQETLKLELAGEDAVRVRLERGNVSGKNRQNAISGMFQEAGCVPEEQRVSRNTSNVICRLPGESDSTIIVGAHFDFAARGRGIVDDWSGVALLPSLYEVLRKQPRRHTFIFVGFVDEELGLFGSKRFVKELTPEQRAGLRAFVNLECLGVGPTNVWAARATPELLSLLYNISAATHIPVHPVNVGNVGDDDSHPFLSAHLPVITLHSLLLETLPLIHSPKDTLEAIRMPDYLSNYKLAAFYLAYLDMKLE